jgi:hypothetical protein
LSRFQVVTEPTEPEARRLPDGSNALDIAERMASTKERVS